MAGRGTAPTLWATGALEMVKCSTAFVLAEGLGGDLYGTALADSENFLLPDKPADVIGVSLQVSCGNSQDDVFLLLNQSLQIRLRSIQYGFRRSPRLVLRCGSFIKLHIGFARETLSINIV